jgi:hypothetical protein
MRYIIFFFLVFSLFGCSAKSLENVVEKSLISTSGNKPPQSFRIDNLQTMKDYVFNTKDFSFSLPSAKESDFTKMGGWDGMRIRDGKTIVLGLRDSNVYHIELSVSKMLYTDREKAIDYKIDNFPKQRTRPDGETIDINVHYETYGKENYTCIVNEIYNENFGKKGKLFGCYKFNKQKTKAKHVSIFLTYNKPNNLTIAKDYTYEDLQQRAERVLDRLYIKDGWDK